MFKSSSSRSFRVLVSTTVLGGALVLQAAPAAAAGGEALIAAWLDDIRKTGATVTVDRQSVDAAGNRVELEQLTIRPPVRDGRSPEKIAIRHALFDGLDAAPDHGFKAASMRMDDISLATEDGSISGSVAFVSVSGLTVPTYAGLSLDEKRPMASLSAFFRLNAALALDHAEIGAVKLDVTPGDGTGKDVPGHLSLSRASLSGLKNNSIDDLAIGALDGNGQDDQGKPVSMKSGGLRVSRLDLNALLRLTDVTTYVNGKGDGAWRDLVASYDIDGMTVVGDAARIALAHAGIAGLAIRQPEVPLAEALDREVAEGQNLGETEKTLLGFQLLSCFRIGSYGLEGMEVQAEGKAAARIDAFGYAGVSLAGIDTMYLNGLTLNAEGSSFSLGAFSLGDLKFPSLETLLTAVKNDADGTAYDKTALVPHLGSLRLGDLKSMVPGMGEVTLAGFELSQRAFIGAFPTKLEMQLTNLRLPATLPDPQWQGLMAGLGYRVADITASLVMAYDESATLLSLDGLSLELAEGGKLNVATKISGLTREMLQAPDTIDDHVAELGFVAARIQVEDRSLTDRALKFAAREQKISPDLMRSRIADLLQKGLTAIPDQGERAAYAKALNGFLKSPGKLTVSANPAAMVPWIGVMATAATNPFKLPKLLNVEIRNGG